MWGDGPWNSIAAWQLSSRTVFHLVPDAGMARLAGSATRRCTFEWRPTDNHSRSDEATATGGPAPMDGRCGLAPAGLQIRREAMLLIANLEAPCKRYLAQCRTGS